MKTAAIQSIAALSVLALDQGRRSIGRALLAGALVGVLVALGYLLGGCASSPPVSRSTVCRGVVAACGVAESYCAGVP